MPAAPQQDISELYIKALNTRDPAQISALYHPKAVHITAARTIQGNDPILNWYTSLVNQVLPKAVFSLTSFTGSGDVRHLKWQALGSTSRVTNGTDTIGIVNGKIHYHYTFFTTTPI
jgi:hypothetical protein